MGKRAGDDTKGKEAKRLKESANDRLIASSSIPTSSSSSTQLNADESDNFGDGELEIDISTLTGNSSTPPTAPDLHSLAVQERDRLPDSPDSEHRRIVTKLFEMSLEAFTAVPEEVVSHACCLRDFGTYLPHTPFVEESVRMLELTCEADGDGVAWIELGRSRLEALRGEQKLGFGWMEEFDDEDDENDEEDEEVSEGDKDDDLNLDAENGGQDLNIPDELTEEEEKALEAARKEGKMFEAIRAAFSKGVAKLKDTKETLIQQLGSVARDLLNYAIAQRRHDRKSPIPLTVLRWTLALLDSTIEETHKDPAIVSETEDGCSLLLVKGTCLYQLAKYSALDKNDKEGASEDLWDAIKVLSAVDKDVENVIQATQIIGQCYILLGSTEEDEDAAAEAFEDGVSLLKQLSEKLPDNERLQKLLCLTNK
ncbi:hypothetical protein HDU97_010173 [Phlyctochytrium planicorne]|nr:hypothetical protein HDU97_010173 [Phlyctochytrium planicorne]